MELLFSLITKFVIYSIFILSMNNIVIGRTGFWFIGHLAFFTIGALITGILTVIFEFKGIYIYLTFPISILFSIILTTIPVIGLLRLKGDFFIFISIAFAEAMRVIVEYIAGPSGFSGIPRPYGIVSDLSFMIFTIILLIVFCIYIFSLKKHPLNNISTISRLEEASALSFGIDVLKIRTGFFLIGAIIATTSGCLYALYSSGTDPQRFTINEAVTIFALTIIGGIDSLRGTLLSSALYVIVIFVLESLLRGPLGVYSPRASSLVFGILLILAINFFPKGLVGNRSI